MSALIERDRSLAGYPSLSAAASMIGVATSTLSRRGDLDVTDRGARDRVLAPREVLRLAAIYRKRSLNEVAGALIEYAELRAPAEAARIENEVEAFFADRVSGDSPRQGDDLLEELRAHLPSELYEEVERRMQETTARIPAAITGEVEHSPARSQSSTVRSGAVRSSKHRVARSTSTASRRKLDGARKTKAASESSARQGVGGAGSGRKSPTRHARKAGSSSQSDD